MTMPLPRRRRLGFAALVAVLALAGCVRADADLAVDGRTDTVSGTISLAVPIAEDSESARETAAQAALAIEAQALPGLRNRASVTAAPVDQEGYYGTELTLNETSIDFLYLGSDAENPVITREGSTYNVAAVIDLLSIPEVAETAAEGESPPGAAESSLRITLTFPGEVTSVAGSDDLATVDGNTITWETALDTALVMDATAQATENSLPPWIWQAAIWAVLGILAIAAIALVLVFVRSRND